MNQKTDAELVALARCGDKAAFSNLIKRHQTLALRVAQKMMNRSDIARELSQEAFLQAYLSLDRLQDDEKFQSWLYGIVINVCRSHRLLRRKPTEPVLRDSISWGNPSMAHALL